MNLNKTKGLLNKKAMTPLLTILLATQLGVGPVMTTGAQVDTLPQTNVQTSLADREKELAKIGRVIDPTRTPEQKEILKNSIQREKEITKVKPRTEVLAKSLDTYVEVSQATVGDITEEQANTLAPEMAIPVKTEEMKKVANKTVSANIKSTEGNGLLENLYTQNDVYLLASLIQSEAGNNASSDELQQWVGQVVINRANSKYFKPTTIQGVIHQKGQYSTANNLKKPTERALRNAEIVLQGKSTCPRDVVFQANFKQGIVVRAFPDKTLGTTSYFGKKA